MEEKTQFVTNETFNIKFKSLETTLAENMSYMQKMQESIVKMAQSISQIGEKMQHKNQETNETSEHQEFKSPPQKKKNSNDRYRIDTGIDEMNTDGNQTTFQNP